MPIDLGGVTLSHIHRITTLEQADFVRHRVPGLEGNIVQDMGRASVRLRIDGICYGDTASEDLEQLRNLYKARKPVDFLAEITGQAYFAQVILEELDVAEQAGEPNQFSYRLTIAEYVQPPEPETGLDAVDASILDEAMDFMDVVELPDLLATPEISDPTAPLNSILENVKGAIAPLSDTARQLNELFKPEEDAGE